VPPPTLPSRASPAAKQLARELGVDLATIHGTGPGGAVTREDVAAAGPAEAEPDAKLRMRRAIAAAMERSNREIPHYYVAHSFEVSAAQSFLTRHNAELPIERRVIFGVLLLKAVALALREFPELNGRWENGRGVALSDINVGMAISLREGGLVIPAVHHTDQLGLEALMQSVSDLVARARSATLKSSELADGTITVTSLGDRGVDAVWGVIYPPQVALVGFGRVAQRPWVSDDQIVVRPTLTATLAADHRVSDGHRGSLFLAALERLLKDPEKLA
jgi:pyruvate dehydrogenase E2 component (dihydrolipoamide acetyltransferase)